MTATTTCPTWAREAVGHLRPLVAAAGPRYAGIVRATAKSLPVVLRPGEDGWTVAECPLIPGCISQGRTRDEALANIQEAIELCLEGRREEGWSLPAEYEVVDLALRP